MISLKSKLEIDGRAIDAFSVDMVDSFRIAVGNLARATHSEWISRAQSRLNSGRESYIRGLQDSGSFGVRTTTRGDVYDISLVGEMPNNFEFGMQSYDMKTVRPGWLGGAKAKTAKDGSKYIVIPFRHSTTSTSNIQYTGKAKAANLKSELRDAVKKYGLDRMQRAATGRVIEGKVKSIPKSAPVHSYLQGLTRIQKGEQGTTSSGKQRGSASLLTFRVMSTKSKPESWIHPGIRGVNLLPEMTAWAESQMDKIIGDLLA